MGMEFKQEPFENVYEVGEDIGSGQFAVVRRCKHKTSGDVFAGKFIRKKRAKASRRGVLLTDIQREVAILQEIDHENIIKLYEVYESKQEVILVLELVSGGELFDYMAIKDKVSEDEAVGFLVQILQGIKHMHHKSIVHLDLKPENVMLLEPKGNKIKLIDFGLSRKLKSGEDVRELLGTPEFVAPEVINYDPLSTATDMWSIGVLTYILLSGYSPFLGDDKQETFSNVSSGQFSLDNKYFDSTSDLAKDFIQKLLIREPSKRASVEGCLEHPWIKPRGKKDLVIRKSSSLNLKNLKSYLARKRWKHTIRVIQLCNRLKKSAAIKRRAREAMQPSSTIDTTDNEEEEENYVLVALFAAIECGNLDGVQKLLNTKNTFDVNQANKHGESALHIAASEGQLEILKYLQSKGIDLNAKDKLGDGAVYRAARQGHVEMLQFLHDQGVSLDEQNKNGESAIHAAVRYGQVEVLEFLCSQPDLNVNVHDKEEETPLHSAASRGDIECIKVLLERGATVTVQDKRGSTPLHLACRRQNIPIALLLLHSGAHLDTVDQFHESALHIAAKDGLLPVVQTLCAFGCMVDIFSKDGYTPLHLAARNGHIEVVRCLLLSGAEPDIPNKDDVPAEILSLSYGHQEIAELLTRLKPEKREMCIRQLMPSDHKLSKIKVKLFGSRGSGKTTLIDSLKCGYFGSFFRKARLSTSSSLNSQRQKSVENGGHNTLRHNSLPAQMSQDVPHESYTRGVDVHYANITGCGELSIWDFSGYEPYYMFYDQLIGDPNCIHIITFSLMEKPETQLKQVAFWLNFLRARVPPLEPFGHCGCHPLPARVIFVATHADKANCAKNSKGEFYSEDATILLDKVADMFWTEFDLPDKVYVVDSHLAMSSDMKAIRCHLGDMKERIVRRLPRSNGFLEAVVTSLQHWRKVNAMFPVVTWPQFMDTVRMMVNLLASEEHLRELMHLLQLMGEVIYVETGQEDDLVVLYPKWLSNDIIGNLLSHEHLIHTRVTGIFSVLDIGLMFPDCPAEDLLNLLTALEFCTPCDNDGELEYEFPCLNFCEKLSGLWEKDPERLPSPVYCGVRVICPDFVDDQLKHLFPRLQVHLRRNYINHPNNSEQDLYQWHHGSKFCRGDMECLITLEESDQIIEIKARGPDKMRTELYYFIEEICSIINDQLEDCVPGLNLQRKVLSPIHLKEHQEKPHVYTTKDLISMQLESRSTLQLDHQRAEEFSDAIFCGSKEITNNLTLGIDLHVSYLSVYTRKGISMLLDPVDALGKDWCLLAVKLGLTDTLPELDQGARKKFESKTDCILEEWSRSEEATISNLIAKLKEIGRDDAAELVICTGPVYRVFPNETETVEDKTRKETPKEASSEVKNNNEPSDEAQSE